MTIDKSIPDKLTDSEKKKLKQENKAKANPERAQENKASADAKRERRAASGRAAGRGDHADGRAPHRRPDHHRAQRPPGQLHHLQPARLRTDRQERGQPVLEGRPDA